MPTTRQWVLYGGIGAGGIAIAAWMYERNKKQKAQTTAATQQANTAAYAYGYGMTEPYGYGSCAALVTEAAGLFPKTVTTFCSFVLLTVLRI